MGRPDGAHTHGSGHWDWRIVTAVAVIGACVIPASRHFMFAGLATALIWLAIGVTLASAALGVLVWRSWRRSRPDFVRSMHGQRRQELSPEQARAAIAAFSTEFPEMRRYKAMLSARYGYPGHEDGLYAYSVHPELIQHGTITGRFPAGPEQAGHGHTTWPQRRDQETWTAEVISGTDAVTGRPYDIYPDPGHE